MAITLKARRPGRWHINGTDLGSSGFSNAPLWLKVSAVFIASLGVGYWFGRR